MICGICGEEQDLQKYRCPSCLAPICSKKCYSEHNSDCTERFYRDRVKSVLRYEDKAKIGKRLTVLKENEESMDEEMVRIATKETRLNEIAEKLLYTNMSLSLLSESDRTLLDDAVGTFDYARGQNRIITSPPWWRHILKTVDAEDVESDSSSLFMDGILLPKPSTAAISMEGREHAAQDDGVRRMFVEGMSSVICELRESWGSMSNSTSIQALSLQIAAVLLGYVDTKRSIGSELLSSDESYRYLIQTTSVFSFNVTCSSTSNGQIIDGDGFRSAENVVAMLATPQSMTEVIEGWLSLRHPLERGCLKAVIIDVLHLLDLNCEGLIYALFDAWLMCILPQEGMSSVDKLKDLNAVDEGLRFENDEGDIFYACILSLLDKNLMKISISH